MRWTPIDIRQMTFSTGFRGYAQNEIDAFLENLASEIEEILKENADLRERIEDQGQTIAELKKTEGALTNTLLMAQKAIEEMKRSAQKEGDLIIRQAELRAEEITRSAMKEVSQVQGEILNLKRQRDFFVEKIRSLMQNLEKTIQWEDEKANQREEEASL
ncbi:DivIVA domain-containing protein [Candidatus Manganitrophus noduliformans]|uniref:DivIVA domain-containing protein n=1 Tax=Candidatus Manganitrophus noduliformans TaxID=2606439 RepID=A0A7X6DNI0_9BACT|nr:DivIVA domain-containing protein [Candidatus Manganitrophus noduliformans]NKE70410.1 DivIVA domain-containing protein [Candidatus Manganitrophus noduliformans]